MKPGDGGSPVLVHEARDIMLGDLDGILNGDVSVDTSSAISGGISACVATLTNPDKHPVQLPML